MDQCGLCYISVGWGSLHTEPTSSSLYFLPHVPTKPLGVGNRKDGSPIGTARDPQRKAPTGKSAFLPRITKTDAWDLWDFRSTALFKFPDFLKWNNSNSLWFNRNFQPSIFWSLGGWGGGVWCPADLRSHHLLLNILMDHRKGTFSWDRIEGRVYIRRWYEPKWWGLRINTKGSWEVRNSKKITKKRFIWGKCKWIHLSQGKWKHRCLGETWEVFMDDCFMGNIFPAK